MKNRPLYSLCRDLLDSPVLQSNSDCRGVIEQLSKQAEESASTSAAPAGSTGSTNSSAPITPEVIRDAIVKNAPKIRSHLSGMTQVLFDVLYKVYTDALKKEEWHSLHPEDPVAYDPNHIIPKRKNPQDQEQWTLLFDLVNLDVTVSDPELQKLFIPIKASLASFRQSALQSGPGAEAYNAAVKAIARQQKPDPKGPAPTAKELAAAKQIVDQVLVAHPNILQQPNAVEELIRLCYRAAKSMVSFLIKQAANSAAWDAALRQIYDAIIKSLGGATPADKQKNPSASGKVSLFVANPNLFEESWKKGINEANTAIEPYHQECHFTNTEQEEIQEEYLAFQQQAEGLIKNLKLPIFDTPDKVSEFASNLFQFWLIKLPCFTLPNEREKLVNLVNIFGDPPATQMSALEQIWKGWEASELRTLAQHLGVAPSASQGVYGEIRSSFEPQAITFLDSLTAGYPDVVPYLTKIKANIADWNHVNQVYTEFLTQYQTGVKNWYGKIKDPPPSKATIVNGGSLARAQTLIAEINQHAYQNRNDKQFAQTAAGFLMKALHALHNSNLSGKTEYVHTMDPTHAPPSFVNPDTSAPQAPNVPPPSTSASTPTPKPTSTPVINPEGTPSPKSNPEPTNNKSPLTFDWLTVGLASSIFYVLWSKHTGA